MLGPSARHSDNEDSLMSHEKRFPGDQRELHPVGSSWGWGGLPLWLIHIEIKVGEPLRFKVRT
jgi:hypothetical protein